MPSVRLDALSTARWQRLRRAVLIEEQFQCWVPHCPRVANSVDHLVPVVRGGDVWDRANLRAICAAHNRQKHDRLPHEFLAYLGLLPGQVTTVGPTSRQW